MNDSSKNPTEQAASNKVQETAKDKKTIPWPKLNFNIKRPKNYFLIAFSSSIKSVLQRKALWAIVLGLIVSLLILVLILHGLAPSEKSIQHNSKQLNQSSLLAAAKLHNSDNPIHSQLNDISAKLANIEQHLSDKQAYVDLAPVRQSLADLQSQVNQLANHSNKMIKQMITSSTEQLQGQLNTIKRQVQVMNQQTAQHKALSASALPFTVMSIDDIQQNQVVSVNFDHRLIPLDIGDSIAGWNLTAANYGNQTAEFKNSKNNFVHINLNQLSAKSRGNR